MKIQLFNPCVSYFNGGLHYRMNPPLGLPILSSVLRAAGHTCEVVDLEAKNRADAALALTPSEAAAKWQRLVEAVDRLAFACGEGENYVVGIAQVNEMLSALRDVQGKE